VLADTEKARADTDKVRADTAKVLIDTEAAKAKAEVEALAPLKGIASAQTTLSGTEKTAEALQLNRLVINGVAERIVEALLDAKVQPSPTTVPLVTSGAIPPGVGQWLGFENRRDALRLRLQQVTAGWNDVAGSKNFIPPAAAGAILLAGTILPMLKVDTTIAGVETKTDSLELENAIAMALEKKQFGVDYTNFLIPDAASVAALLAPLKTERDDAQTALDAYRTTSDATPAQKAAGDRLGSVMGEYNKLETDLGTETNGSTLAMVLMRQKGIYDGRKTRPLIYLTTVRSATTTVTRKGFFTGIFGSGAPTLSGYAIADYVIMLNDAKVARGTVICSIANLKPSELAVITPVIGLTGIGTCS